MTTRDVRRIAAIQMITKEAANDPDAETMIRSLMIEGLRWFAERESLTLDPESCHETARERAYSVPWHPGDGVEYTAMLGSDDDQVRAVTGEMFAMFYPEDLREWVGYQVRWEGEAS